MAYFFTFLFLTAAFITPEVLFGPLGQYHIETVLALLAILASIPSFGPSGLLRLPQTYAVIVICFAVVLSMAATGWLGGILQICYGFLPVAAAFFLTAVNCRKKWHLELIVLALVVCSAYFIARGALDLHNHVLDSPYLYSREAVPRLRGLGYVNDPNDFGQVMVSLIPLVFLWRSKSKVANIFLLGIPIALLLTGMFLTHSRGASIALMVVVLVGLRKKIGTVPAAILAGLVMAGGLAAGWGAGRSINIDSGEGRLDAWAQGLQFIKSHPLLGVGYSRFADVYGITAHNSVVVCAAEIGLPGFFAWVLFLVASFRFCLLLGKVQGDEPELAPDLRRGVPSPFDMWAANGATTPSGLVSAGGPVALLRSGPAPSISRRQDAGSGVANSSPGRARWSTAVAIGVEPGSLPPEELRRMAGLMIVALAGFLTAGWFLSRALSIWLFMYCGMACAILRMAQDNGMQIPTDRPAFLLRWTLATGFVLILAVYVVLRVHNIIG